METLKLTKTPIVDMIWDGCGEQSPLAERFFQKLRCLYGLEPVACYADCRQIVRLRETGRVFKKTTAEGAERINKMRLTLYLRGLFLPEAFDGEQKAHILAQFLQTAAEEGQQLAYPRSYTEQEQAFYGWKNQPVAEWDLSKRIEPSSPPRFSGEIDAESFDGLALWHILSGRMKHLNGLESVRALPAKVNCGWDARRQRMNAYVILPESAISAFGETARKRLAREMQDDLTARDKWGVFERYPLEPVYTVWSALSDEMKFCLLRE